MHAHFLKAWKHIFVVCLLTVSSFTGCVFNPQGEVTGYVPEQAYNGYSLYNVFGELMPWTKYLAVVDMEGTVAWSYRDDNILLGSRLDVFPLMDAVVLPNGNILTQSLTMLAIDPSTNETVWQYIDPDIQIHHDVDVLPDGNIMFLYQQVIEAPGSDFSPRATDGIRIIDPSTKEVLWDWRSEGHISFHDYCPLCITKTFLSNGLDWLHANTLIFREEPEGDAIYINYRNLNRFCKIDYPSGDMLWCLGDGGDFGGGLFSHAHDPEFLPNGDILLFDNGLHRDGNPEPGESRVIEIAFDPDALNAEIVWEWSDGFYSEIMGDADRLPNGNILVTDAMNGRIVELTPDKEVVWEYQLNANHTIYKTERIDEWPLPSLR